MALALARVGYGCTKLSRVNFQGSSKICENHEKFTPRKFLAVRYTNTVSYYNSDIFSRYYVVVVTHPYLCLLSIMHECSYRTRDTARTGIGVG